MKSLSSVQNVYVVGIVGVPAKYGGFETLVENLLRYNAESGEAVNFTVFCSARSYADKHLRAKYHLGARLIYLPVGANGIASVVFDLIGLIRAALQRADSILILGVSGALGLPFIRFFSRARIVVNIDGLEWKRAKWGWAARRFLRFSERIAVHFADRVIADNAAIASYVEAVYARDCDVIPYGGDHAFFANPEPYRGSPLPGSFAFAVCRIEPENNVAVILEAFARCEWMPLVFVGNWDVSHYGRMLREKFGGLSHIYLLDPIYDLGILKSLRDSAILYVHGHSAGGTNPALVEMMHFGIPIFAYDCVYNRCTTNSLASYFTTAIDLAGLIQGHQGEARKPMGKAMMEIATSQYTWDIVGRSYLEILMEQPHRAEAKS